MSSVLAPPLSLTPTHKHTCREVSSRELVLGLSLLSRDVGASLRDKCKVAFRLFDDEGWGDVSRDRLGQTLRFVARVSFAESDDLDAVVEDLVQSTFAEYDTDKNERLDFDEFVRAAESNATLRELFTLDALFKGGK